MKRLKPIPHTFVRLNRASIHMASGNAQDALDDANVLLELAPGLALAKLRRAEANMMLTNWEAAKDDLEVIIEDAPHHHHALTQLAACYISMDRPEKAESSSKRSSTIGADHTDAWHHADSYILTGVEKKQH